MERGHNVFNVLKQGDLIFLFSDSFRMCNEYKTYL